MGSSIEGGVRGGLCTASVSRAFAEAASSAGEVGSLSPVDANATEGNEGEAHCVHVPARFRRGVNFFWEERITIWLKGAGRGTGDRGKRLVPVPGRVLIRILVRVHMVLRIESFLE